ncbi:MAG: DUF1565 domain-containing protein [Acidobacteria bacterium]|nr:DUF1565 domain-containing protein [Acidobacteriota bacterium]
MENRRIGIMKMGLLLMLTWAVTGQGATLYVSPSGNDGSGNGSISAPFLTITHALDTSSAGDIVLILGGTYNEAVRIRNANITLQAYNGEHVIIHTPIDDENLDTTVTIDVDADGSTLDGLEITGGYYYGIMLFTRWDWGDPADRTGVSHITIENCEIHDTGRDCIKITPGCDYVTIDNCEVYNSGARYGGNAEGVDNVNADNMIVKDCYIHDTATTGVYAKGGAIDALIERCIIENCGEIGVALGFDTSPEYFDLTVNPNRYENIGGVVKNCLIRNTTYAGIAFYAAKDASAFNNTVINTAQSGHSPIYFGVTLQDWEVDPDPNDGIGYRPASVNIHVENNIVLQDSSITTPMVFIRTFYHEGDVGRVNGMEGMPVMDHNCYWQGSSELAFTDQRPGYEMENGSFVDWQNHIGFEEHTLVANPLLDSSYRPAEGSPCIDAGDSTVPVTDDLDGNPRVASFDIGAYEVSGSQPPEEGTVRYLPHIAHGNYTTYLLAYTPANEQTKFQVTLYGDDGGLLQNGSYTLAPRSTVKIDVSSVSGGAAMTATVILTEGTAVFKGVYFNTAGGMAEFLLDGELSDSLMCLFPSYNDAVSWNGLACWNASDTAATVTLTAYAEGVSVGVQTVLLAPRENLVDVIGQDGSLLNSLGLHDFDMIQVQTNVSVLSGLNISGDGQEKLIFTPAVRVN